MGAIYYYLLKKKKKNLRIHKHGLSPYLGPSFSKIDTIKILDKFNLKYESPKQFHFDIAKNISLGKIVGVFDGRAEYGQRSLGNRSILADPRSRISKLRLNLSLKKRDWFMPFAPSILDKDFDSWFPNQHKNYYMQVTNDIKNKVLAKKIPSAVHVDGSSRCQYVDKNVNPNFWKIISQFKKITKTPIVLNTSFNRHGISTISNPRQAVEHLLEGSLDVLYINGLKVKSSKKNLKIIQKQLDSSEYKLLKKENLSWIKKNKHKLSQKNLKSLKIFLKEKFSK